MRPLVLLPLVLSACGPQAHPAPSGERSITAHIDGTGLRLGTDTMTVTVIANNEERPGGLAITSLATPRPDQLEMTYRWLPLDSDSVVVVARLDRRSLQPLSEERRYGNGAVTQLEYGPWGVRGETRQPNGNSSRHSPDSTARGVYPSTAVDLVLRALPLAEGYAAQLPVLMPSGIGRWSLAVRVVGSETIRTRAGLDVTCWLVEADFPGPATERFWVATANRDLIRVLGHAGPNVLQRYDR